MQNVAYINLKQLVSNAKEIKKHLKKDTKFCAVVKADGYGHGGVEVANAIYALVDSYAVCLVEEGIALRLSGIDKEILVFSPIITARMSTPPVLPPTLNANPKPKPTKKPANIAYNNFIPVSSAIGKIGAYLKKISNKDTNNGYKIVQNNVLIAKFFPLKIQPMKNNIHDKIVKINPTDWKINSSGKIASIIIVNPPSPPVIIFP